MATGLYKSYGDDVQVAGVDIINGPIHVMLVATGVGFYEPDLDNDSTKEDIPLNAIIAEETLDGNSLVDGAFIADDVTFPSLSSDLEVGAIVIYQYSRVLSTSKLIFCNDGSAENVNPFPIATDGTDFTITWPTGTDKIFRLLNA